MVRQLKTDEKGQLSITEEDVQALNCLKLVMTLKKIALNDEMDKGEKLEMVKNLQMQFCQTDSDTEMGLLRKYYRNCHMVVLFVGQLRVDNCWFGYDSYCYHSLQSFIQILTSLPLL